MQISTNHTLSDKQPILVTGTWRSGKSTLVEALCASKRCWKIVQPFGRFNGAGAFHPLIPSLKHPVTIIGPDSTASTKCELRQLFDFGEYCRRYSDQWDSGFLKPVKRVLRQIVGWKSYQRRIVIDDPFILFSAEWIAAEFNARIAICIRRPESFVASCVVRDYSFDFEEFLAIPGASDLVSPETQILIDQHLSRSEDNLVLNAAIYWRLAHERIAKYRCRYPEWNYVRFEDLILQPFPTVCNLLQKLEIETNEETINLIVENLTKINFEDAEVRAAIDGGAELSATDAREQLLDSHRFILDEDEISEIISITSSIAENFYNNIT